MNNLSKRIITSFFLLSIVIISLSYHKYLWLILLALVSLFSYIEFNKIVKKIWKKNQKKIYLINLISFSYLLYFIYTAYLIGFKKDFLFFILLICIFSDVGGYFVGKIIGGKKLTKISPNKTISGSLGSFFFSFIAPIIYYNFFNQDILFIKLLLVTLFLSFTCQIGDLLISYFKRKAKVKDTGNILPGHGGILDRIDGIIFTVPIAYLIKILVFI